MKPRFINMASKYFFILKPDKRKNQMKNYSSVLKELKVKTLIYDRLKSVS